MSDRIELRGLRVVGTHGVLAEEQVRPQPFEVDLDLVGDLVTAGHSDALTDTYDYGSIVALVATVVRERRFALLEALAETIAREILGTGVREVTVVLRKLRPPVPYDLASAGVRITRRNGEP